MSKKHKVKKHHWHNGVLHSTDHNFASLEEAMVFAKKIDAFHVKVYTDDGELVHTETQELPAVATETYA